MSPSAGLMLIQHIQPLIMAAIARGAVRLVGSEDREELTQDTLANAAAMLDRAEGAERPYTASTVAYYAIQAAKGGRRAMYKGRSDALCPAAALDGNVQTVSFDASIPTGSDAEDEEYTLHDALPAYREGPDQEAGRRMDWDDVSTALNEQETVVLRDAAFGIQPSKTADALAVSRPRVTQLRRQVANRVNDTWKTDDPVVNATTAPAWQHHVNVSRERRACRAERRANRR